MLKAAEVTAAVEDSGHDCWLSECLGDSNTQALAYADKAYEDTRKLDLYDEIIKQLESS